jgi:hypothetical protein
MSALSNHLETLLLTWHLTTGTAARPTAWHLAVGTGSSDTGLTGEPSGNGYARQSITFSVTDDLATNTNAITIGPCSGTNWGTMSHFAIFDATTGGNLLWHGALTASKLVEVGDSLTVAIGDIDLTLS